MNKKTKESKVSLLKVVGKHVNVTQELSDSVHEISNAFIDLHRSEVKLLDKIVGKLEYLFKVTTILLMIIFGVPLFIGSMMLSGYLIDLYRKSSYDGKLSAMIAIIAIIVSIILYSLGKKAGIKEIGNTKK